MDIQYTILGLLNWQSLSGYDLKKIIAESELFYWSGNNNQIYNRLIELHNQGLVSQVIIQQESLPAKKIYTITDIGREELHRWLLSEPELPEFRNNFLIKLAWTDELSGDELDAILARYADEINIQLKMRNTLINRSATTPNRTQRERFLWKRIDQNMLSMYQREFEWVNRLRQDLQEQNFSND
jgi:PadR family transcriptional regulator AphA